MAEVLEIKAILKVWSSMGVDHLGKTEILEALIGLSEAEHFPAALLDFWKDDQAHGEGIATAALLGYLLGQSAPQAHDLGPEIPDLVFAQALGKLDRFGLVRILTVATQYLGRRARISPDAVYGGIEAMATYLEAGQQIEQLSDATKFSLFVEPEPEDHLEDN